MKFPNWAEAISIETPAGLNVEYDALFVSMQQAMVGKPEQQYGEVIIPAEEPDWRAVVTAAEELMLKSKDVRVLAAITQAWTAIYGLAGFAAGCKALVDNLDSYWTTIYPLLHDEDDAEDLDPFYRINALSLLVSAEGVVKQLGECRLMINGLSHMPISIRDAEAVLDGSGKNDLYPGGRERLILDLKVSFDAQKEEVVALLNALTHLEAIEQLFATRLAEHERVSFELLYKPLSLIKKMMSIDDPLSVLNDEVVAAPADVAQGHSHVTSTDGDAWRRLQLRDREDVGLVLEKVCLYFEQHEPSHPAPLFIRRIQRLMNMNFHDIIKDISPDSVGQLEVLIGQVLATDSVED